MENDWSDPEIHDPVVIAQRHLEREKLRRQAADLRRTLEPDDWKPQRV